MGNAIAALMTIGALFLAGCSTNSSSENPVSPATATGQPAVETNMVFQYTGYSGGGVVIVCGTITLTVSSAGRVAGTWALRGANPERIGPQVGTGTLSGSLVNGVLSVNLNPQYVDNNVMLNGRFSRTEYSGRWEWVGLAGVLNAGTFRAARSTTVASEFTD